MALSEIYDVDIRVGGAGPVRVISGGLAGTTDTTVYTPAAGNCVFLVGQYFAETSPSNLTYKSGSTTIVTPEFAASQGVMNAIGGGVILATKAGQALVVNASVAISSVVFHVIEAKSLDFH